MSSCIFNQVILLQEINKDISCFEDASRSEQPLFTLCDILLTQIESSIDNVMRTNNFTMPIKIIIELYDEHPTAYARLMLVTYLSYLYYQS